MAEKKSTKPKKVPSPTGKPSKKRSEIEEFEKNPGKATGGGGRKSEYSKPKPKSKTKKDTKPKRKYGMDAPARRREKKEKGLQ